MANAPNHVKHFPPNKSNKDDTPLKNMRFFHYQHIADGSPSLRSAAASPNCRAKQPGFARVIHTKTKIKTRQK
ncbi:hypothetical protein [Silvimonas sp.]|uniref:hypothetical protein n=1 Tax=Silvimonas sp. TaxID=2650811 RepID=UPI00283E58B0|nr:hypothetical protein [Silvimonas sp.]MDR3430052.1 hypothetical protein [Silvimonas sp.]